MIEGLDSLAKEFWKVCEYLYRQNYQQRCFRCLGVRYIHGHMSRSISNAKDQPSKALKHEAPMPELKTLKYPNAASPHYK